MAGSEIPTFIEESGSFAVFDEKYRRFASRTMVNQLSRRANLLETALEPFCETVFAAVLFADISGFTRLSARLSEDELKYHINEYFSMLLGVVKQNHGDTIKFCGDAVMIMWSVDKVAEDDVKAGAVLMASVCALQLVGDCGSYDRGEGTQAVSLRLHCGIGCGEVHCMCVGEKNRWEYLISGDPIRQVGLAEPEAGVGQTCLSPEAYWYVHHRLDCELMPKGSYRLTGATRRVKARIGSMDTSDHLTSAWLHATPSASVDECGGGGKFDIINRQESRSIDSTLEDASSRINSSKNLSGVLKDGRGVAVPRRSLTPTGKTNSTNCSSSKGSSRGLLTESDESQPRSVYEARVDASVGCFACLKPSPVGPSELDLPTPSFPSGRPPLSSRETASSSLAPEPSDARRKSFIVDIGNRMKTIGKSNHANSTSNMSVGSDFAVDIDSLKAVVGLDSDPGVLCARAYLSSRAGNAAGGADRGTAANMATMLRPFIHEAALQAIESDLFEFGYLAEKRMVVTMFIEILGLEQDFSVGNVRRPQQVMEFVLACLNRFEGSLRQFVVDDKGCVIICAFGLPGTHHEDNCTRAVETAKAINKSLEVLQISCRTGITMGPTYCGLVGSTGRCEYAMMGSSVNLAARLMGTCIPGSILTNESVYHGACEDFEFSVLQPIKAKGYENLVDVFSPVSRVQSRSSGILNRPNRHCKFVGRREEIALFRDQLACFGVGDRDLERTIGSIIEGPPGIGKTSLVAEIDKMVKSNSNITAIAYANASASHASSSYFVARQLLHFVLSLDSFKAFAASSSLSSRPFSARPMFGASRSESKKSDGESDKSLSPPVSMSRLLSLNNGMGGNLDSRSGPNSPNLKSKFSRLPSLKMDKKYTTFSADDRETAPANAMSTLEAWVSSFRSDIMVAELDPVGSSTKMSAEEREKSMSFEAIYLTGESSASGASKSLDVYSTGVSSGTDGVSPRNSPTRDRQSYPMKLLLPLLADILSIPCEESSVTASLTPVMRWRMCDALIVQILRMVMDEEKIIFIVENLQWCDYQSLCVLFYLLRDTVGGLFIGTQRPPERMAETLKTRQLGRYNAMSALLCGMCTAVPLQPLPEEDVYSVMEQVVGIDSLDSYPSLKTEEAVRLMVRRTDGLPFTVIALCLALKTALANNKFVDINRLSSGVHNVIVNRFDQLSTAQKVVLKVASVIGRIFGYELLRQALLELNCANCTSSLHDTLACLADAKLITPIIPGKDMLNAGDSDGNARLSTQRTSAKSYAFEAYKFTDQSIQYGVYNLMLGGQCELVHGVIATLLEAKYLQNSEDTLLFAEVVHHFNLAAASEKKLTYLRLAARGAEASKDYKMCIHYNAELIKFATNMSLEMLIEWCFGKGEARLKGDDSAALNQDISMGPPGAKVAGDLRVVRNIFAGGTGRRDQTELISPRDSWLALNKVVNQLVVTDSASKLGATKTDVCRWIAAVADAKRRVGLYNWGNNLCIVALGCLRCSLVVDDSCTGLWKRRLKLKKYPHFWQRKTLRMAMVAYENLALFQILRGHPDTALSVLKMAMKVVDRNDPAWVREMGHQLCRLDGLFSLAYLGCGEACKASSFLSNALSRNSKDNDAYTNACILYVHSFHLAANGLFSAALDLCSEAAGAMHELKEFGLQHLVLLSAGWYSFMLGDVGKAVELYKLVFEYGLSTADRSLIKMSLELHATILLMSGDFTNANLVLDHLKSPLQTGEESGRSIRPSSIKSSLVALSCTLHKRYIEAVPHIQFACQALSDINPSNPICGVFLFFSAHAALDVLLHIEEIAPEDRPNTILSLQIAAQTSVGALGRCLSAMPSLKLLHLACLIKQQLLEAKPNPSVLNEGISADWTVAAPSSPPVLVSRSLDSSERYSPNRPRAWEVSSGDSSMPPKSAPDSPFQHLRSKWVGIGNIGVHDEFAFGKLFYHKERDALCKKMVVDQSFSATSFSSVFYFKQLLKLYAREPSVRSLMERREEVLGTARLELCPDSARGNPSSPRSGESPWDSHTSPASRDHETSPNDHDAYVSEQLGKLRAYEQQHHNDESDENRSSRYPSFKKYQSAVGSTLRLDSGVIFTPTPSVRFSPAGGRTPKIHPNFTTDDSPLMSTSPTKVPVFASVRRGSI